MGGVGNVPSTMGGGSRGAMGLAAAGIGGMGGATAV